MNKFCEDCGTLLDVLESQAYCYRCDKYRPAVQQDVVQEKTYVHQTPAEIIQIESRPTTDKECPVCGNRTAYYVAQQMRSADEGQTLFYECQSCGHKYKENT